MEENKQNNEQTFERGTTTKDKFNSFYNKHYKTLLLIPLIILILSISFIGYFYFKTGDFINRDISLSGGTTITLFSNVSDLYLQNALADKIPDLEIRYTAGDDGNQNQIILITSQKPEEVTPIIEEALGYKLTDKNSNLEFTGSNLSDNFYKQLVIAILIAFFWMAAVVFIIFAQKWKIKMLALILNLFFGIFLGKMFLTMNVFLSVIILLAFIISIVFVYIKYSIPSFAVMLCAFADIVMTLAIVDLLNLQISGAGIVAFLMLIGYSVDTDILLTTRVLTRKNTSVNREIFGSFKTGMTMTLTAMAAIGVALGVIYHFGTVLNQMFIILLIGLSMDILNTWVTNTSLIKWFAEKGGKL